MDPYIIDIFNDSFSIAIYIIYNATVIALVEREL